MTRHRSLSITIAIIGLLIAGCGDQRDERLAAVSVEAVRQQAEQNRRMVDLQEQVAVGSRRLVEADTQARREMTQLHHSVVAQQSEVGRQRDRLDEERKALAGQRNRETIWAAAIHDGACMLACLLPLVVAVLLLWPRPEMPQTAELSELLIAELSMDRLRLSAPASFAALPEPEIPDTSNPTAP